MADKLNRVGIKVPAAVHREINMESARTGTPIYSLMERAWAAYLHVKSTAGGTSATVLPTKSHAAKLDIASKGKPEDTEARESASFTKRIGSLFVGVPPESLHAAEEMALRVVRAMLDSFVEGVVRGSQSDSDQQYRDIEVETNPEMDGHVPAKRGNRGSADEDVDRSA